MGVQVGWIQNAIACRSGPLAGSSCAPGDSQREGFRECQPLVGRAREPSGGLFRRPHRAPTWTRPGAGRTSARASSLRAPYTKKTALRPVEPSIFLLVRLRDAMSAAWLLGASACSPTVERVTPPTPPAVEAMPPTIAIEPARPVPAPPPPPEPITDEDIAAAPAPALEPAAALVRKGDWKRAREELQRAIGAAGPGGSPAVLLIAHALLARTCTHLGDDACASAEVAEVSSLWAQPDTWQRLDALGGDDRAKRRRLGSALLAVGEAHFLAAERKRAAADRVVRPIYRGAGDRRDVLKFINTRVVAWVKAKRSAIEDAERAYRQALEMRPVSPPRWAIAASARIGALWAAYADEFLASAPVPREWRADGVVPGTTDLTYAELRREYTGKLAESIAPQIERARAAFRQCSELGAEVHISDAHTRTCDAWLAAHPTKP